MSSNREKINALLDSAPEYITGYVLAYVQGLTANLELSQDIPSAETKEAIEEVQRMKRDPALGKTYTDVDQMMKELLA